MPIHEYECSACGNVFERLQRLSDADPVGCPRCGKPRLHRRISAPSFRLVGSGWYETDFKGKGEAKHNLASTDAKPPVGTVESTQVKVEPSATTSTSSASKSGSDASTSA